MSFQFTGAFVDTAEKSWLEVDRSNKITMYGDEVLCCELCKLPTGNCGPLSETRTPGIP